MKSRAGLCIVMACLVLSAPRADAEEPAEAVHDLLEARWYAIELIVFERLPVMDFLTPESLVATGPRSWPADLRELVEPGDESPPVPAAALTVEPSPRCLGFPTLEAQTPEHPRLTARRLLAQTPQALNTWLAPLALSPVRVAPEPVPDAFGVPAAPPGATANPELGATELQPIAAPLSAEEALLAANVEAFEAALADYEAALWREAFTQAPLTMDAAVRAINRQSHLRPLLHRRWQQAVPPRDAPLAVRLGTDDLPPTLAGLPRVEGSVAITVGRYLHAAFDLWYHADTLGMRPLVADGNPADPATVPADPVVVPYMQLKESRRMRSGELHYIDHPKIGVVLRIDPVTPPPALLALWERTQPTNTEQ